MPRPVGGIGCRASRWWTKFPGDPVPRRIHELQPDVLVRALAPHRGTCNPRFYSLVCWQSATIVLPILQGPTAIMNDP
jgi:hypothetical protein